MAIVYLLISLIIIIVAYKLFRVDELSFDFFLFWAAIGCILFVVALFPGIIHYFRDLLYSGHRKGNFIFIVTIVILYMLNLKLSSAYRELKKKQGISIQKQALQNFQGDPRNNSFKKNDVLVKMAVYNEEENIVDVLSRIPENIDVLVIDDGSTDNTASIAKKWGAAVLTHATNLGQGAADITGFRFARAYGYNLVIEMDGDGQHDPTDIPAFIKAITHSDVDIITGSRILGFNHPGNSQLRALFLPFYTKLLNRLTHYQLTDSMCGYKAFKMAPINNHFDVFEDVMETQYLASELYIRLAHKGFKVDEIPIHINERKAGLSRKGTIKYGLRVLRIMLRIWLLEKLLMDRKEN